MQMPGRLPEGIMRRKVACLQLPALLGSLEMAGRYEVCSKRTHSIVREHILEMAGRYEVCSKRTHSIVREHILEMAGRYEEAIDCQQQRPAARHHAQGRRLPGESP